MDIKVIKNQEDYEAALQSLSELMDRDPAPGSLEENSLELLMLVIRDYEQKIVEAVVVDPVEAIKFRMDQMDLSRQELIPYMGSISRVSEVLSGKRNLSLSMIRKLHEGLGIPLESLLGKARHRRVIVRKERRKTKKKQNSIFSKRLKRSRKLLE